MFPALPVQDTDMRFLALGTNDARERGMTPGLYISLTARADSLCLPSAKD